MPSSINFARSVNGLYYKHVTIVTRNSSQSDLYNEYVIIVNYASSNIDIASEAPLWL
jgi:hypothetical protein